MGTIYKVKDGQLSEMVVSAVGMTKQVGIAFPTGVVLPFAGSSIPNGWLICDGSAVSRSVYSSLFRIIGETYGAGDGSTTFNLPDLREAVPKGAGSTGLSNRHYRNTDLEVGEFIDDRAGAHEHAYTQMYKTLPVARKVTSPPFITCAILNASGGNTSGNSGRNGATTETKAVGMNYCIRT